MGIRGTTPRVEIAEDGSVSFTTLIEEKKIQPVGGGPKRREVRSVAPSDAPPASPSVPPAVRVERKPDAPPNLTICRGC